LFPVAVTVAAVPEAIAVGEIWVTVGFGLVTANAIGLPDTPPPGGGFVTVRLSIAPEARSACGITAVSPVLETNVVFKGCPLRFATDEARKPLPMMLTVVSGAPAVAELGLMLETDGIGLGFGCGAGTLLPPPLQAIKNKDTEIRKHDKSHDFPAIAQTSFLISLPINSLLIGGGLGSEHTTTISQMQEILKKIGQRIAELRKKKGFSQEDFAHVRGFHRSYMGAVERGEKNLTLDTVNRIVKALKISFVELFRGM